MDAWSVAAAKAKFSEVIDRALSEGPHAQRPAGGCGRVRIAATVRVHELTLVTRNTADFEGSVSGIVNPWS